jgi:nicotinamidase-related amidase
MNERNWFLSRDKAGLLVVDVQERLFPLVERYDEILQEILKTIKGFQILKLPIVITEQYPEKMGKTVHPVKALFQESLHTFPKTVFSCVRDRAIKEKLSGLHVKQWVLVGIEAHVCIQQTVKELLNYDYQVAVVNNAISSRSLYDFSTSIAEMRDSGARITSVETVLFELMGDSKIPEFKEVSRLIK